MTAARRPDDESRPGPSRAATLLLVGAVLGAGVVLFAWTNTEPVPVDLFLWQLQVSKALLMFGPLGVGLLLGWALAASRYRGRGEKDGGAGNRPRD